MVGGGSIVAAALFFLSQPLPELLRPWVGLAPLAVALVFEIPNQRRAARSGR